MILELQRKILKKFLVDEKFALKYITYLQPDFFENELYQNVYKNLRQYYFTYNKLPSLDVIKEWFGDGQLNLKEFERLKETEIVEDEWIEDKCKEFILYSRTKDAVYKIIDVLKKQEEDKKVDYSVVKTYIDEALKVSFEEEGYRYFSVEKIKERLEKDIVAERVPTGIRTLDVVLEGGLGKGELGIVAGITGFGKTMLLQNFAVSAVLAGKPVIYYSFENREEDLARRFDRIFTEMTESEIRFRKDEFFYKVKQIYEKHKAELIIKWFPMYSITPYYLKNDILTYKMKGLDFGLVIIDYGQRLKAPVTYSDRWQELVMIYDLLASMALELNVPIWTAIQVIKEAMRAQVPDLLHVSGARDVMNSADIGISIAQTNEEKERGEMRLFIMKARRVGARKLINLKVNYELFLIRSAGVYDTLKKEKEEEKEEIPSVDFSVEDE
jgi:replicative DNA helicase